jgi:uncharacterized alpha-E superfamily protein
VRCWPRWPTPRARPASRFNLQALARASQALRERLSSEQWGLIRSMGESFAAALEARRAAADAGAGAAGAGPAGAATGGRHRCADRPHDARPRLAAAGRGPAAGAADRRGARFEAFLEGGALGSAAGVELLLELFDSAITFRARYQRHEDLLALADLLVLDSANPRAYAGVLRRLRTELGKLPGSDEQRQSLLAELPAEGAGLTLEALRGADDAAIGARLLALSRELGCRRARRADRRALLRDRTHRMQRVHGSAPRQPTTGAEPGPQDPP